MKIKIDVLPGDILAGEANDCECCPIAMAINRVLKDKYFVKVYCPSARLYEKCLSNKVGYRYIYTLSPPEAVRSFIKQFDISDGVVGSPFSFELDIPHECLK